MGTLTRLENERSRLLRAVSGSSCVRFGTTAPFALGRVGFDRIGFAQQAVVGFRGHCRERDIDALVPVARQHIMRHCAERGLELAGLELRVSVRMGRERMFVDENNASASVGKRKRGAAVRFWLEIEREFVRGFETRLERVYLTD